MQPLRIVFLGSDPIALPLLEWLWAEGRATAEIVACYTQPDRPVGRGQQIVANEIKRWALQHSLPVLQPEKLTTATSAELAAFRPDVALVMAYGHILKDDVIVTPRLGTLNLHTSRLPKYRGASPIQSAIANGERETAVTLMRIVRALDAGPVADFESVSIASLDTAADIEIKLAKASVPLMARALPRLAEGTLPFVEQDHTAATFCRRLTKADGVLDFAASAATLAARINGLFPWPACSVQFGDLPIKLGLADVAEVGSVHALDGPDVGSSPPGTVLGADPDGLLVATGRGVLRLRRLQRPGGRLLAAADFLRGFPIAPGTRWPNQSMPALVNPSPF